MSDPAKYVEDVSETDQDERLALSAIAAIQRLVEERNVLRSALEAKDQEFGFNAQTETYENLTQAGVIDPVKVVRTALQNAASIASLLLTTECVVVERKEEEKAAPAMPGGGMGGMY